MASCKVSSLSFKQGCEISTQISCGIDLIRVSVPDSISGFREFLALQGSTVSSPEKDHYRYLFTFNVDGVGYEGTTYRKTITLNFAGLRQYSHTSQSKKRWLLLQQLYKHYGSLEITELHFAFDLPYAYGDLKFTPVDHLAQPRFLSTKYFDTRRKYPNGPVRNKDSVVIYDKCRKCKILNPLTRIELRLSNEHLSDLKKDNGCIISSDTLQEKLVKKIDRKIAKLHIKKRRGKLNHLMNSAPKEMSIKAAMQYIQGDDSLLEYLLSHQTLEIMSSSKLFSDFVTECKKIHIFGSRPYLVPEIKTYLNSVTPVEKHMIHNTISNYNKYDKHWYLRLLKEPNITHRLTDSDKDEALFLYQVGETQKEIASKLGVSESQISRLFLKQGYRKLKDSHYYFGYVILG